MDKELAERIDTDRLEALDAAARKVCLSMPGEPAYVVEQYERNNAIKARDDYLRRHISEVIRLARIAATQGERNADR